MKILGGRHYLKPIETSQILCVNSKTVERWAEEGVPLGRGLPKKKILEVMRVPSGFRYYSAESVEDVALLVIPGYVRAFPFFKKEPEPPLFYEI